MRLNLTGASPPGDASGTSQAVNQDQAVSSDADSKDGKHESAQPLVFAIVEDHIKDSSQSSFHSFSPDSAENAGDPNADELNDREDADGNQANKAVPIKYTDGDDKDGRDDMEEDDNILRK